MCGTAGLDSHAALVLMEFMRKLTSEQRTVICSIHQPRQAIWEMFHKVEVLSEGHLMYFGSTSGAVAWFNADLGYCYNPTQDGTPSDWLLDLVSIGFGRAGGHSEGMSSLKEVEAAAAQFRTENLPGNSTSSGCVEKCSSDSCDPAGGAPVAHHFSQVF
jgi:ABC-type multidrug transport system ATPase subunit